MTSYRLAILGYGAGMALSLTDVPAGLLLITATAAIAAALFLSPRRAL